MSLNTVAQVYRERLVDLYRSAIPLGQRVLEVGCGDGSLLAALEPSLGVGVDHDEGALNLARQRFPHLRFECQKAETLALEETFDFVIMSDLLVSVDDVLDVFERVRAVSHENTRWLISSHNAVWQGVISLAERLGLKRVGHSANWLGASDILNLFRLADVQSLGWRSALPVPLPILERFLRPFERLTGPFNWIMLFDGKPSPLPQPEKIPVTVIVPTRNEAGNIRDAVERIPEMGSGTEIIFVDGSSTDGTQDEIEAMIKEFPQRKIRLIHQIEPDESGGAAMERAQRLGKMLPQGKAHAVRKGFYAATGEVLMICDADLTVAPEDLPRFYNAIASGKADFINGSRMLYPMEDGAMRYINLLGNKFFSVAFSWILGHYVKDTLCGTKVFRKSDLGRIMAFREQVGDFDPFGDFEQLYGAAAANLRIIDLPIRYRRRLYGQPKIENFRHSLLLFKMIYRGIVNLKMGVRKTAD